MAGSTSHDAPKVVYEAFDLEPAGSYLELGKVAMEILGVKAWN